MVNLSGLIIKHAYSVVLVKAAVNKKWAKIYSTCYLNAENNLYVYICVRFVDFIWVFEYVFSLDKYTKHAINWSFAPVQTSHRHHYIFCNIANKKYLLKCRLKLEPAYTKT